ncbi:hypothetical protein [Providencia alcalifaciens]|uniref:hypothetical protein n=1 Tax=Providencia alcalifaciens TaxID=126385 RepID=UPI0032DA2B84
MNQQESQDKQYKLFIERLKTITSQQFLDFLDEKKVNTVCAMCGHDGEQIVDETGHTTLEDVQKGNPPNSFVTFYHHQPAIPGDSDINYYYKLTCSHCGFITTHSVRNVLIWLDSKSDGDESK